MTSSARDPDTPIRVLRLITRLNIGGPSIQAMSLSDKLRERGFETLLVHGRLGAGEGDMSYLLQPGVKTLHLPSLQRPVAPLDDVRATARVLSVMREFRPAIVHTHMAKAGAVGRLAAMVYNRTSGRDSPARLVHTYHGHVLEGYFSPRKTRFFIGVERRLARATDRIVAISPQIKRELIESYGIGTASQYRVVPLGFELERFARIDAADRQRARVTLNVPAPAPVITTVGRLTAIKQHHLLLDAARLIVAGRPDAVFLIAGDGELRAELEQRAQEIGLTANVRFLGWRRDLETLYAATDVFALTSRNEGTPVALIEAMASAVPGVSTDVGGVSDVIVDSSVGRRVPDANPRAFANAVHELLRDENRAAIGARARSLTVSHFGLDRLVSDITALYNELLHARI